MYIGNSFMRTSSDTGGVTIGKICTVSIGNGHKSITKPLKDYLT